MKIKLDGGLHKNAEFYSEQILEAVHSKDKNYTAIYLPSHKPPKKGDYDDDDDHCIFNCTNMIFSC